MVIGTLYSSWRCLFFHKYTLNWALYKVAWTNTARPNLAANVPGTGETLVRRRTIHPPVPGTLRSSLLFWGSTYKIQQFVPARLLCLNILATIQPNKATPNLESNEADIQP